MDHPARAQTLKRPRENLSNDNPSLNRLQFHAEELPPLHTVSPRLGLKTQTLTQTRFYPSSFPSLDTPIHREHKNQLTEPLFLPFQRPTAVPGAFGPFLAPHEGIGIGNQPQQLELTLFLSTLIVPNA